MECQIKEGLAIEAEKYKCQNLLNSKAEWGMNIVPRLQTEKDLLGITLETPNLSFEKAGKRPPPMAGETNGPISNTPQELDYFDNQFRQRKKRKVMQSDTPEGQTRPMVRSSSQTQRQGIAKNEIFSEVKANHGLSLKGKKTKQSTRKY